VLGADYNRVCLLLAVLEKLGGMPLGEPGRVRERRRWWQGDGAGRRPRHRCRHRVELHGRAVAADTLVLGEVGLTGEVRA